MTNIFALRKRAVFVIDLKTTIAFTVLSLLFLSCKSTTSDSGNTAPTDAKYVLPYPVGKSYTCSLGFNSPPSHIGTFIYSTDFTMPVGTLITAARSGRVVYILESYSDTDKQDGHENVVIVMHTDSTYARYVHLTFDGAFVSVNQMVAPGDTVGLSGSSGTNGGPHLHFDVTGSYSGRSDQTIPFDFKNTIPHPLGLQQGTAYVALPY